MTNISSIKKKPSNVCKIFIMSFRECYHHVRGSGHLSHNTNLVDLHSPNTYLKFGAVSVHHSITPMLYILTQLY